MSIKDWILGIGAMRETKDAADFAGAVAQLLNGPHEIVQSWYTVTWLRDSAPNQHEHGRGRTETSPRLTLNFPGCRGNLKPVLPSDSEALHSMFLQIS